MAISRSGQNWPSNTAYTIRESVIRDETGNLRVRQARAKLKTEVVETRHKQEFDGKTVVDILNRLQMKNNLYRMIMKKD